MRILLLDIETAPNVAFVWGLFDQNISINQVQQSSYVLCWAAQWLGEKEIMFRSVQSRSRRQMLWKMRQLLDEADVVVHYNGRKFDLPVLRREFVKLDFKPPSPFKQIDLYQVCKAGFRFESNKLDYITQALDLGAKIKHAGFELWVQCMNGDREAWKQMERYNRGDVKLLEKLYKRLMPWIVQHPNRAAYDDIVACPKCGAEDKLQRRGFYVASMMKYHRYQCQGCGAWSRGNKSVNVDRRRERITNVAG